MKSLAAFLARILLPLLCLGILGCSGQPSKTAPTPGDRLRDAASKGRLDEVTRWLADGVDPNDANEWGQTPLMAAAQGNRTDIIDLLLEAGADINAETSSGQRAIEMVSQSKTGLHLLASGADVSYEGSGLLEHAANFKGVELVVALLDAGVEPQTFSNPELLKNLAQDPDYYGLSSESAELLLLGALDTEGAGSAVICLALKLDSPEVARGMVEGGADPNSKCQINHTPLAMAIYDNDLELVKSLVEAGADVNKRTPSGDTPLVIAAANIRPKIARFLVDNGADVSLAKLADPRRGGPDKPVSTPLITAAEHGVLETMQYLLDRGAGAHPELDEMAIALEKAGAKGWDEAIELLNEAGAKLADDRVLPDLRCNGSAARLLIEQGVDPDRLNPLGELALVEATECSDVDLIDALIAGGANIDGRDREGKTALHAAVTARGPAAEHLVNLGAEVDARDSAGKTPLMLAVLENRFETDEIVKRLVLAGADIDAKDPNGRTALILVADQLDSKRIALLAGLGADDSVTDDEGKTAAEYYTGHLLGRSQRDEIRRAGYRFDFLVPQCLYDHPSQDPDSLRTYSCGASRSYRKRYHELSVAESQLAADGSLREVPSEPGESSQRLFLGQVVEIAGESVIFVLSGEREQEMELGWMLMAITNSVRTR